MFLKNNYIISFLTILLLKKTVRPWEFSPVEDNVVITTEVQIRLIMNTVIQMFDIDTECAELLEHYFIIHNNLLAQSLQDSDKWNEVVKAAKVNVSGDMIDIVSEIINEYTNYRDITNIPIHKDEMIKLIDEFLQEVDLYNMMYGDDIAVQSYIQNGLILKNSSSDEAYPDISEQSYENETDFGEFWTPQNLLEESGRRIFSSISTTVSRFPFMAAIIIFGHFHCAGTIIAKDLVITAASGVQLAYNNRMFRENPAFLAVRVGSTFHTVGGDLIAVLQVYFHPNYDPRNLNNNICVLRLVRHIRFRNKRHRDKRVKKIGFDKKDSPLPNNIPEVLMLGWGAKSAANKMPMEGTLRYARLNIYAPKDCQEIYSKEFVTIQNFCAGYVSKGSGACNQDVGDPGIINGILHGIVSFGAPQCGAPDSPTVFTKIGFYSDWIETIMEEKVSSKSQWRTTTRKLTVDKKVTPLNDFPESVMHSRVDTTKTVANPTTEPTELQKESTTMLTTEPETTTYYAGRTVLTVDTENVTKKKHGHKKKTTTGLYDDHAPFHSPDYIKTVIKQKIKKHRKVTSKHMKVLPPSQDYDQYGDDESQILSATNKPPKSHHHNHKLSADKTEWKPTKTTQKAKKTKKNKHKHLIHNNYDKTTTKSPLRNSSEILTGKHVYKSPKNIMESSKPKIKNSLRTDIKPKKSNHPKKSKKNRDDAHEKLLHDLHEITNLKDVDYNQTNPKLIYDQKKIPIIPGTSADNKNKPTEKSKSMNSYLEPNYFEPDGKHYDNLDMYDYDYVPTYDGKIQSQDKKILETPDHSAYKGPEQNRMKVKSNKRDQSNTSSNPLKEAKLYEEDYEEHHEMYEKGNLINEYGSPDHEKDNYYNSEEYYNSDYEQSDRKKDMKHKISHISGTVSSLDPVKNDEIDLPKDLGKLESHELKLMFLEQLSKQSGDLSKMTVNRDLLSNKESSFPEQSLQTPPTDTLGKVTEEKDKGNGIYDLIKSAFNQIKLNFRQAAETTKHAGKIRRRKKGWYDSK